jgi:hypothetical protein
MRTLIHTIVLLVVLAAPAFGQPRQYGGGTWSPNTGWDIPTGQEQLDQLHHDFDERARKMHEDARRDFEESKKRMDDDFNRSANIVWGFIIFVGIAMVLGIIISALRGSRRPRVQWQDSAIAPEPVYTRLVPAGSIDVSVLRIAIDGRASKFVQTELGAIVKTYPADTAESRARRLRETSIMLRRVRDSWVYGGADNDPTRPRDEAIAAVARHVDEARSRLTRPATPAATPSSSQPVGLILVSIIVAARGELMTITDLATGEDLRRALEAAVDRAPNDLLAVEVVWMPTAEGQQLSSVDLEAHYRKAELHPLGGARVGKTFCTYCGGPFPMELVSCPHCGAPAREARAS